MNRRTRIIRVLLLVAGGLSAAVVACSSKGSAAGPEKTLISDPDSGDDGNAGGAAVDAASDGADSAPPPPQAYLRVAHLSPGMGPIDVCVAPHGTTNFAGPLVAGLVSDGAGSDDAGSDDAGNDAEAPGVAFAQVSAYIGVDPGQFDVRIVAAGATSCASALPQVRSLDLSDGGSEDAGLSDAPIADASTFDATSGDAAADAAVADAAGALTDAAFVEDAGSEPPGVPDTTNLPALAFNTYSTLIVTGDGSLTGSDAGLTVAVLRDDAVLSGGAASLRAVNAVPGAASLDFGLGSFAMGWMPLLVDVTFGDASQTAAPSVGVIDAQGYLPIDPASVQTLSARASSGATTDTAVASDVTIAMGSIVTVFAIGGATESPAQPASLLICTDNQPSGGFLSDCSVAQ